MSSATEVPSIRISRQTKATLQELAKLKRKPVGKVLDEAIEQYRRATFLDQANTAYARLRKDRKAWNEELADRAELDGALMDDLSEE
jgi:predicted transcriptional regulator